MSLFSEPLSLINFCNSTRCLRFSFKFHYSFIMLFFRGSQITSREHNTLIPCQYMRNRIQIESKTNSSWTQLKVREFLFSEPIVQDGAWKLELLVLLYFSILNVPPDKRTLGLWLDYLQKHSQGLSSQELLDRPYYLILESQNRIGIVMRNCSLMQETLHFSWQKGNLLSTRHNSTTVLVLFIFNFLLLSPPHCEAAIL